MTSYVHGMQGRVLSGHAACMQCTYNLSCSPAVMAENRWPPDTGTGTADEAVAPLPS